MNSPTAAACGLQSQRAPTRLPTTNPPKTIPLRDNAAPRAALRGLNGTGVS